MYNYREVLRQALSPRLERDLSPLPTVCLRDVPEEGIFSHVILQPSVAERRQLFERGIEQLCKGGYALLILSGGLATRLGSELPKAMLPISPVRRKTLLQLHLERIKRLESLIEPGSDKPIVFIMTSRFNHDDILNYLESVSYCGLEKRQVVLFQQETAPYLSFEGHNFFTTEDGNVIEAPRGNGDVFHALSRCTKFINLMYKLKMIHVIAIDNVLSRPLDPELLGLALRCPGVEVLNKCVVRRGSENVGVFCLGTVPQIVEYSELEKLPADSSSFLSGSSTVYGNMCDHLFSGQFLRRVIEQRLYESLPYHAAKKAVVNGESNSGRAPMRSMVPNGYALELFIFDIFKFATKLVCIEVDRDCQFAPVKYFADSDFQNLLSAQHRMSGVAKQWLTTSGATVGEGLFEISPLLSYGGENLENYSGKHLEGPLYIE